MKFTAKKGVTCLYFAIFLAAALTLALLQPLQDTPPGYYNPPDEHSRYLVPLYICNHGSLPTGFEEELISGNVKWTYGFYTLLPYMVQGTAMRIVNQFTTSPLALLYTARLVNVIFGLLMAWVVLLLGRRIFQSWRSQWLFCFLVTMLPQCVFLHSYVNPDSLCLFSTALMLYGLVKGYQENFTFKACLILALGVIFCALSYYDAYGFIISGALLFTAWFLRSVEGKWRFDWKGFWKKGLPLAAFILLCISWSFIRNYILYDGDIIGLTTKENFIKAAGIARDTWQSEGKSLYAMLTQTEFFPSLINSFIACFGSMRIYTWHRIYQFYKLLIPFGLLGLVFVRKSSFALLNEQKWLRIFIHLNLVFCMAMPFLLLVRYAYTVDFQAQGRYIMPALIPLMFYVSYGLEKWPIWEKIGKRASDILYIGIMAGILFSLLYTVYAVAVPCYLEVSVL